MDYPQLVRVERKQSQLWLTLDRADKANAMTVAMVQQLTSELKAAAQDEQILSIVLTGAGERVFCAGVDVREQPEDGDQARQRERRSIALAALQDAVMDTPKPVVVALNGMASGGGGMLALLADACLAAEEAAIALAEIDIGIATFSGANILETIGGRALALDLIQSGRKMPAREAMTRGLVRSVVAREDLHASAIALADALGKKPPQAFADNKRWINRSIKAALAEAREEHARHRAAAKAAG